MQIKASFSDALTAIHSPSQVSWRDDTGSKLTSLLRIELLSPDKRSEHKGYWAAMLEALLKDGWKLTYTDGTGRNDEVAGGIYRDGIVRGGDCISDLTSVADGERLGKTLALQQAIEHGTKRLCVLTDFMTALYSAINLSRGATSRSGIEIALKAILLQRGAHTM